MKILCVEDGSVNIDVLETDGLKDGQVLVYRSGAKPPFVIDIPDSHCELYQKFKHVWEQLRECAEWYRSSSSFVGYILDKMDELEKNWQSNPPTRG